MLLSSSLILRICPIAWVFAWVLCLVGVQSSAQAGMLSYTFDNIHQTVPDNSALGLSDSHVLSAPPDSIFKVTITLNISGGYNGDLYAQITHDSGFSVLLNRVGKRLNEPDGYSDSGFALTFSDSASSGDVHIYRATLFGSSNTPITGPLTGLWAPDGRTADPDLVTDGDPRSAFLGSFAGLDPSGRWTLFIADDSAVGESTLESWKLDIETVPEASSSVLVIAGTLIVLILYRRHAVLAFAIKSCRLLRWNIALRTFGISLLLLSLVPDRAVAEDSSIGLRWDKPIQEINMLPADKDVEVHFGFQNTGQGAVKVNTITTSCGCTTAQLEKRTYQPGEKGEIVVHYTGDPRSGVQRKTVLVQTDDKPQQPTTLELKITHQMPVEVRPMLVYWRMGDANDTKTAQLLAGDKPVHVLSVTSSNPRITATIQTVHDGKEYNVVIQPKDTTQKESAQLSVTTDYPVDSPIKYTIYARILPALKK